MSQTSTQTRVEEAQDELTRLYQRYGPRAYRFSYVLVGERGLAEDLTQEAFLKVSLAAPMIRRHSAATCGPRSSTSPGRTFAVAGSKS